jgi:hypothetical protein
MRDFLPAVCVGIALVVVGAANAVAPPVPPTQMVSPADAASAKEALATLGKAFGVQPAETPPQEGEHKTMGDVADKTIDLVGKAVASVSSTLEKVAPHVWQIMVRQQYANAVGDLLIPWGLVGLILVLFLTLKKMWVTTPTGRDYMSNEQISQLVFSRILPTVGMLAFGIWGVIALGESIKILINPEYYAVRDIITMLLGR